MRGIARVAGLAVLVASLVLTGEVRAQDTAVVAPATLIGTVVDTGHAPLAGAEISVLGAPSLRTLTSDSGTFRLGGLPVGSVVFSVRRLGFEPATFTAQLKAGRTHRATLTLNPSAQRLPVVSVADTLHKSHWLDVFDARRSSQRGTFLTRSDIERRNSRNGTDLVRTIPGVRVTTGPQGNSDVSMTRAAGSAKCTPQLFVHGVPYSGTMDDFAADDIEALEVYVGISEIPAELARSSPSNVPGRRNMFATPCAAIVIWTRDPRKKP
jgi:hypothetical protein